VQLRTLRNGGAHELLKNLSHERTQRSAKNKLFGIVRGKSRGEGGGEAGGEGCRPRKAVATEGGRAGEEEGRTGREGM